VRRSVGRRDRGLKRHVGLAYDSKSGGIPYFRGRRSSVASKGRERRKS
jgi:hypothetical protein